ncbi:large conductance mechanosensitive channel protein [Gemella bergeri ATCC 700627]|uniref:Large-conductance mechanosensitive channel n=1 Tax=Gemella bergeri ATCC 700627 TaxID=1321820 RepID=U2RV16_9BACL|nr:large conductance mechanosensitive channel protein MscL [Gemella bergeri]ERK57413.1 large conductance mechanosensitive channel protein [Gemella bergeri ATCC 700627]
MLNEFKKFAFKGNVLDLAIGVIMGAAFGKIVSSLVADIMMPLILLIFPSKPDFTNLIWNGIHYGNFIQIVIDFLITAIAIFIFVKAINTAKDKMVKQEAAEEATPEVDAKEELLKEIRDLLKSEK